MAEYVTGTYQTVDFLNRGNSPTMFMWYRSPDDPSDRRLLEVDGFTPRFYVKGDHRAAPSRTVEIQGQQVPAGRFIKRAYFDPKIKRTLQGEPITRIDTHISYDVGQIRERLWDFKEETLQASILLPRVLLMDTGVRNSFRAGLENGVTTPDRIEPVPDLNINPRIHYGDIETDNRDNDLSDPEDVPHAITMHSWIDSYNPFQMNSIVWHPKWKNWSKPKLFRETYHYEYYDKDVPWKIYAFPDEKRMLQFFVNHCVQREDPDIMTGWNFINFDMTYIINRLRRLHINPREMSPLCKIAQSRGISSSNAKISTRGKRIYLPGREVFDMHDLYKMLTIPAVGQRDSYELDNIGWIEAKLRKIHHEGSVGWLWYNNLKDALRYNARDVEILLVVDRIVSIFETLDMERREVGCLWRDVTSPAIKMGTDQTRAANAKGIALPSTYVPDRSKKRDKFKGAVVLDQQAGIHFSVLAFDLKSMYLNLIDQWNISPDVRVYFDPKTDDIDEFKKKYIMTPNGLFWRRDVDGFARERVRYYQEKRQEIRDQAASILDARGPDDPEYKRLDRRQKVYKTFSLVFWGVFGHEGSELYEKDMAGAVTASGRSVLLWTRDHVIDKHLTHLLEKEFQTSVEKLDVIYGDSDSVYVELWINGKHPKTYDDHDWDVVCEMADYISNHLTQSYKDHAELFNCPDRKMSIRCEDISSVYYSTLTEGKGGKMRGGKKRYLKRKVRILVQQKDKERWVGANKTEIKGFEGKKSDNSRFARKVLNDVYDIILDGLNKAVLRKYLKKAQEVYLSGRLPKEEVGIPKGITKPLNCYGRRKNGRLMNVPPRVRGAKYMNLHFNLGFVRGKPFFVYVDPRKCPKSYPRTDVITFRRESDFPDGFVIDYEKMWRKQVVKKIDTLFRPLNLTYKQILIGRKQATLRRRR